MTIPQDTAISFTMGHVFAVAGGDAIMNDPERARACLRRGRLFSALVTVPVGGYFVARWPDWSWFYIAGEHSRSPVALAAGLGGYMLAHELGFRHAAKLIKEGRKDEAAIRGAASLSLLALLSAVGWKRFRWQGTREEFEAGTATDVFSNGDFLISLLVAGAVFLSAAAYVAYRNMTS